jgi:TolB protein
LHGNTDICIVSSDGTGLANVTNHPSRDTAAAWSPDGEDIIFSSDRDGASEQLHFFRMKTDGSGQKRLTGKPGYEMMPAWASDGRLFFAGDRIDGRSRVLDIFSIDPENPDDEGIIISRRFHDSYPSVSPDGRRIVFVSQSDGNDEIYLMNADGSGLVRLTRNLSVDTHPKFSSDGMKVIFSSNRNGRFEIFEIAL